MNLEEEPKAGSLGDGRWEQKSRGFPGDPMVKTSPFNVGGVGSMPGWEAKIPHPWWPKKQNRSNIVTNSIKTLKMVCIKKILKEKTWNSA